MGEKKRQELSNFHKKMCKFKKESTKSFGLAFSGEEDDGSGNGEVVDVAENTVKKGKRRKKSTEKEVEDGHWQLQLQDPLSLLGSDIMHMILSYLDARSVALCLVVSRGWHGVACTDRLWSPKCEELWLGKAHIPRMSRTWGLSKLHAYSLAVVDGKRMRIMRDDLRDHIWEFHFREIATNISNYNRAGLAPKDTGFVLSYPLPGHLGVFSLPAAPEYWRNLDPYWTGTGQPMHRYFHPDGSQTADLGDKVWGGHEACYSVVTGLEADGKIREHYVRINRWPQLSISRKQDWSWEMSNNLVCYSSIPDPEKEDGTGPFYQFC